MKQIQLTQGKIAFVDDEDFEFLNQWKWRYWKDVKRNCTAYAIASIKSRTTRMHRLLLQSKKGDIIDHRDRDGLNNQKSNLRVCTHSQNNENRKVMSTSKTGIKGVRSHRRKWKASITKNGKYIYLGLFKNKEEASERYKQEARVLFGDFAYQG